MVGCVDDDGCSEVSVSVDGLVASITEDCGNGEEARYGL